MKALFLQELHADRSKCRSSPGSGFPFPFLSAWFLGQFLGLDMSTHCNAFSPGSVLRGAVGLNTSLQLTQA